MSSAPATLGGFNSFQELMAPHISEKYSLWGFCLSIWEVTFPALKAHFLSDLTRRHWVTFCREVVNSNWELPRLIIFTIKAEIYDHVFIKNKKIPHKIKHTESLVA